VRLQSEHCDESPLHFAAGVDRAVSCLAQAKQLAIVADKENSTGNVKAADLANILNGKTKNWADGKPVKIILRDPSSRDMELVFRRS